MCLEQIIKILFKEEFSIELNKIFNYDIYDIKINTGDVKTITDSDVFQIECFDCDIDDELNSCILSMEDIDCITKNKDVLAMSVFEQCGYNSAQEVIKSIVLDFEKEKLSLMKTDGILIYFQTNSNYQIMDISEAVGIIQNKSDDIYTTEQPELIWGISCDNELEDDYMKATVFISYSKKIDFGYVNNFITTSLM